MNYFHILNGAIARAEALGMRNFSTMVGDFGQHDDPMLVNYICSRSLPRRGIKAQPEQILVTLGAQNALYLVAQLLVNSTSTWLLKALPTLIYVISCYNAPS